MLIYGVGRVEKGQDGILGKGVRFAWERGHGSVDMCRGPLYLIYGKVDYLFYKEWEFVVRYYWPRSRNVTINLAMWLQCVVQDLFSYVLCTIVVFEFVGTITRTLPFLSDWLLIVENIGLTKVANLVRWSEGFVYTMERVGLNLWWCQGRWFAAEMGEQYEFLTSELILVFVFFLGRIIFHFCGLRASFHLAGAQCILSALPPFDWIVSMGGITIPARLV